MVALGPSFQLNEPRNLQSLIIALFIAVACDEARLLCLMISISGPIGGDGGRFCTGCPDVEGLCQVPRPRLEAPLDR